MAMSDEIRSVRSFLGNLSREEFNPALMELACNNLEALAEQAEVFENIPLAVKARHRSMRVTEAQVDMFSLLQ